MSQERSIEDYLYKYEIQTRILDQSGGHLNNSSFFVLFELAVDMFMAEHGLEPSDPDHGRLVRHSTIDYNSVVHGWPNPVTVGIGCTKIGTSSIVLELAMFQYSSDARAIGTQLFVFMNKNTLRPDGEAINPTLRAALEKMLAHHKKVETSIESSPKL